MITRVSTYSNFQIAIDTMHQRESSLAELQRQISSGVKYDNFAQITGAGQTRRVVDFNSSIDRVDTFQRNNEILTSHLNVMDTSLSSIQDIVTTALSAISQERSAVKENQPLGQQLKALLQQVEDRLNAQDGGRYVFGGATTNVKPVDSLQTSSLDGSGGITDNYYNGDATDLAQKIDQDVNLTYGIRANDPVFQKLIGGLHQAIKAEADNNDTLLATAFDSVTESQTELTGLRNLVGNNLKTLQDVGNQHDNFKTYYQNTLSSLEGTDVAEATIQLSLDQSILTASFQAFARVSGLSLSQYLR